MATPADLLASTAAARIEREFAGFLRAYDHAERDLLRAEEELFEVRPEVSGWSVADHRFHLCLASELVVRNLRALRKGAGRFVKAAGAPVPEAVPILARGILPRGEQAPRIVSPPEDYDRAFLQELVVTGREGLEALRPGLQDLAQSRLVLAHQTLGALTPALWVRFGRMHAVHHQRLVREIDASRS